MKVWTKDEILDLLDKSPTMIGRSLLVLYRRQTGDEQEAEYTYYTNEKGFNKIDAEILSSFAKQYDRRRTLSNKQLELARKRLPKYWKQLLEEANHGSVELK